MNGGGDALARGARSATFGPAKVSQAKWDAIWAEDDANEPMTNTTEIGSGMVAAEITRET